MTEPHLYLQCGNKKTGQEKKVAVFIDKEDSELTEAKQKLETDKDSLKKETKRLEESIRKLEGEIKEQKSENS